MDAQLGRLTATGDAGADAVNRLAAVGHGYIRYALDNPGLFATAFPTSSAEAVESAAPAAATTARRGPFAILGEALEAVDAAELLVEPVGSAALNACGRRAERAGSRLTGRGPSNGWSEWRPRLGLQNGLPVRKIQLYGPMVRIATSGPSWRGCHRTTSRISRRKAMVRRAGTAASSSERTS
ncbi:TetR-like C-terminal domain-containing protein [Streptomyces sp. NPDC007971]|uniref:TetR-like C-terminal domain-containing protein n=1 Tax=Streptomyces sp. NPDC007971 TaxID=3364799 RepID=UPI0036E8694C